MIENNLPGKKSVIIVLFLSVITLGIYSSIWFIKRSDELNNLQTPSKMSKTFGITALTFNILLLITAVLFLVANKGIKITQLTDLTLALVSVFTATFIIFILIYLFGAFRARKVINEALSNKITSKKVSTVLTFFFNVFYLQYEINRVVNDKENEKRIFPWIFLIIYLISLGYLIYFISTNISFASLIA